MDLNLINELIKMMEASKLSSMELEWKDLKIKLAKNGETSAADYTPAKKEISREVEYATTAFDEKSADISETISEVKTAEDSNTRIIKSPMVGTFYSSPSPDKEAYVSAGSSVKKGDTLCIIEAMKLMNEIESEEEGTIVEVLLKNGDLVEYGQPLFKIK